MKTLIFAALLSRAMAATWNVEVTDAVTSEVKKYSFHSTGDHALQTPSLKNIKCFLFIDEAETKGRFIGLQAIRILCGDSGNIYGTTMSCNDSPTTLDKQKFGVLRVSEANKTKTNKDHGYLFMVQCE